MKRSKTTSKSATGHSRALDARRLTAVRGGSALGIAVEVITPPLPLMQMQHNETLIRVSPSSSHKESP